MVEFARLEAFELCGDRHRTASRSDLGRRLRAGHAVVVGAVAEFVGEALFELAFADGDAARIDRAVQARGFLGDAASVRWLSQPGRRCRKRRLYRWPGLRHRSSRSRRPRRSRPAPEVPESWSEPKRATSVPAAAFSVLHDAVAVHRARVPLGHGGLIVCVEVASRGVDGHRDVARFFAVHTAERGEPLPELERTRARRFVDRVVIARGGDGEAVGRGPFGRSQITVDRFCVSHSCEARDGSRPRRRTPRPAV